MAASFAAAIKDLKWRTGNPYKVSVSSSKEKLSPKRAVSVSAAAVEITLCPLVYSGKGGILVGVQ